MTILEFLPLCGRPSFSKISLRSSRSVADHGRFIAASSEGVPYTQAGSEHIRRMHHFFLLMNNLPRAE